MRPSRRAVLALSTAVLATAAVLLAPSAPAVGPVFGNGTPTYVTSLAPASLFGSSSSGEPSVGVNWNSGAGLFMAGSSVLRLGLQTATQPAAVDWTDVTSLYSLANLDPILATDPGTGLTLAGGDDTGCSLLSRTTNDGAAWSPSLPCTVAADHPTVGIGPFSGATPLGATGTRAAYYCQQQDVTVCSRSLDGGTTWSPGVSQASCFGLFGHVKVSADGTAYVPSRNCSGPDGIDVGGFKTSNNGLTWSGYAITGAPKPAAGFDPSVTTTPDNTVYESWARQGDFHPVVASSTDHGATWGPQVDLAGTVNPPLVASTFQAMTAGDNGRVAVAFLGTTTGTAGLTPFSTGYHGTWNLYVSHSYDGGRTWTTAKVTTAPVQLGSISDGGVSSTGQRNLLDFMDAQVTKDGRVLVGYATGCLPGCTTEGASTSAWATAALQTSGKGLFAAYDVP